MPPAPGWYRDPTGRHWSRFWDRRWFDAVDGLQTLRDALGADESYDGPPVGIRPFTLREAEPPANRAAEHRPPDWYRDPAGDGLRYWDGTGWTANRMSESGDALTATAPDADWDPPNGLDPYQLWRWQEARRRHRRRTALGCGIAALWVVGSFLTLILAAIYAIGNAFYCADSGYRCNDSSPLIVLGLGVTIMTIATVFMVRALRSIAPASRIDAARSPSSRRPDQATVVEEPSAPSASGP